MYRQVRRRPTARPSKPTRDQRLHGRCCCGLLRQVLAAAPSDVWALRRLGLHELIVGGDADAALGRFQLALRIDDSDRATWTGIGECYRRQGTVGALAPLPSPSRPRPRTLARLLSRAPTPSPLPLPSRPRPRPLALAPSPSPSPSPSRLPSPMRPRPDSVRLGTHRQVCGRTQGVGAGGNAVDGGCGRGRQPAPGERRAAQARDVRRGPRYARARTARGPGASARP